MRQLEEDIKDLPVEHQNNYRMIGTQVALQSANAAAGIIEAMYHKNNMDLRRSTAELISVQEKRITELNESNRQERALDAQRLAQVLDHSRQLSDGVRESYTSATRVAETTSTTLRTGLQHITDDRRNERQQSAIIQQQTISK